jgi:hypothetical protein
MNIIKLAVHALACLSICACSTTTTQDKQCVVTPPATTKVDRSATLKAAADLTKLAQLPLSANFDAETKTTVDSTFQTVSDKQTACAMLLQTYACISDRARAAQFQNYMSTRASCQ